jgi:prophage DNA circulation protein
MGALDTLKDIFFGGPSNWEERLAENITLISPEGKEFKAKWIGSPRTKTKKVGTYFYPKVKGNVVKDLDVNSTIFPLTFYFDGPNNDLNARAFFATCDETGPWEITHPVHGFFELQLLSVTEEMQPVTSGGLTKITSEWIEPIDEKTLLSGRQMAGIVDGLSNDLNQSAIEQFIETLKEGTEGLQNVIETTTNGISNVTDFALSPVAAVVDAVDSSFLAIQRGIQDTLNATVFQARALAGQIQNLIQVPVLGKNDLTTRLQAYDDLKEALFLQLPGLENSTSSRIASTDEAKNNIALNELALTSVIVANAQVAITAPTAAQTDDPTQAVIKTRAQAIEVALGVAETFDNITDALDAQQESYANLDIDKQYFSQSQAFGDVSKLVAETMRYLLLIAYDLKVERRFTLTTYRAPIEIVITEYGDLGDNEVNLSEFIEANALKGTELLLLPPGKEVVVYA